MESHDSDHSENEEELLSWGQFDTLPPEIILHICSFLSAKFVINVLSRVCRMFKEVIDSDATWKMRIFKRWPKSYPVIPPIEDLDWKAACVEREEHHRLWSNHSENMRKYHLYGAHIGCVNVVKLIENGTICVSGGRDGFMKLWKLDPDYLESQPFNSLDYVDISTCIIRDAHHANAWLWDIAYDSNSKYLFTGGFDRSIKCWDIDVPQVELMTYGLTTPILCLAFNHDLLASGCYGRTVNVFDLRDEAPVLKYKEHSRPVLCIASDEKYVISGSEDKSVVVYDKIAGKVLKRVEINEGFPLCMSYSEGQLIVGDVNSHMHFIDTRHGEFNLYRTFPTGHSKNVTGIQPSLGSIITGSTDKTIRILEPNIDPEPIAVIQSTDEVSRISVCNNILASANVDDSISIWVPNEMFD